MATDGANPEAAQKDPVLDFLQKFTLGSMRLKPDKWHRLLISDEMRNYITNFVDRPMPQVSYFIRNKNGTNRYLVKRMNQKF